MKKIIAISVMFVLLTGAVFAVDLGGTVFGRVNVLNGSTEEDSKVTSSGAMDRIRIDGSGEAGDGAYGGYIRLQGDSASVDSANAWWKPIDQFRFIIGNNSDGFWGKEGVTGWSFNQMPYDCGIAVNSGIWYGSWGGSSVYGGFPSMHSRYTFFGGFGDRAALLEIKPIDVLGINIAIPFFNGGEAAEVFKQSVVQFDVNVEGIGNIALTYVGGRGFKDAKDYVAGTDPNTIKGATIVTDNTDDKNQSYWNGSGWTPITKASGDPGYNESPGTLFFYFGGTFGGLGVDFGLGYHMAAKDADAEPIGVGIGLKYVTDSFGVKFRTTVALAGDDKCTYINANVLPYFNVSESIAAFVNVGLGMIMGEEDSAMGWFFNPYLRVGAEWGPSFYFGIQVASQLAVDGKLLTDPSKDSFITWSVPIALVVSF